MQHSGKQYVVRRSAIRIPAIRASTAGFSTYRLGEFRRWDPVARSERESSTPTRRRPLQASLASSWWQMVWPNPPRRTNTPLTLWRSLNGIIGMGPQKPAVIDRHYRTLTARCRGSSRLRRCFRCPCIWRLEDKGTPGAYDPPFRRCCATR